MAQDRRAGVEVAGRQFMSPNSPTAPSLQSLTSGTSAPSPLLQVHGRMHAGLAGWCRVAACPRPPAPLRRERNSLPFTHITHSQLTLLLGHIANCSKLWCWKHPVTRRLPAADALLRCHTVLRCLWVYPGRQFLWVRLLVKAGLRVDGMRSGVLPLPLFSLRFLAPTRTAVPLVLLAAPLLLRVRACCPPSLQMGAAPPHRLDLVRFLPSLQTRAAPPHRLDLVCFLRNLQTRPAPPHRLDLVCFPPSLQMLEAPPRRLDLVYFLPSLQTPAAPPRRLDLVCFLPSLQTPEAPPRRLDLVCFLPSLQTPVAPPHRLDLVCCPPSLQTPAASPRRQELVCFLPSLQMLEASHHLLFLALCRPSPPA